MDAKILQIILRAKDEATKTINSVEKAVTKSTSTMDKMAGTMKIAGAAITTASVASAYAINNMAQTGGRLYDLENSFDKLAKGAGTSMDTLLSELQEATAGTIENSALIENSVRAAMLGLPIEKMSGLFKIARQQSVAMGEDMGFMLDSIVKGIGRASPMILDNLGITISLGEVYENAAKSLGKKTEELTKAEQQQALTNAVLEWGAQKEKDLGGVVTSNVDSYKRMEAAVKNVKDQMSKYYFDTLAPVIEGIGNLADKINSVNPDILKFAATFTVAMTGIGLIVGPILLLIGFLPALAAGAAILGTTLGVVIGIALAVVVAVTALVAGFVAYKQNLFGFRDAVDNVFGKIKGFVVNAVEAVKSRLTAWKDLFVAVGGLIKAKIDGIVLSFRAFKAGVMNVVDSVTGFVKKIVDGFRAIPALLFQGDFTGELGKAFGVSEDSPIIASFLSFRQKIVDIFNGLKAMVTLIFGGDYTAQLAQSFGITEDSFFVQALLAFRNVFTEVFGFIGSVITAFVTVGQVMFENFVTIVSALWTAFWDGVMSIVTPVAEFLTTTFTTVFEFLKGIFIEFVEREIEGWTRIWNFIVYTVTLIKDIIVATWNIIKSVSEAVWSAIVSFFQWVWSVIGDDVIAGVDFVKNIISTGWDFVVGLFNTLKTRAMDAITSMWDAIKQMFTDAKENVLTTIQNMADGIINILKNMRLPKIKVEIEEKEIGGIKLKIPHLSMYQFGGMVPNSGLAYLHAGEFVMSRGMVEGRRAMPPSVNNNYDQPISINFYGDQNVNGGQLAYTLAWHLRNTR